ncbi:MAG: OmpA family protein [Myxococcales bacterium]|nr:OmpA family protein [Myxococcales bacterium]
MKGHLRALTVIVVLVGLTGRGMAKDNLNTQTFRPSVNGKGMATNESGEILGHLQWTVMLILNYANKPVSLFDRSTNKERSALIANRLGGDLAFAIGLFGWVELGLDVPATIVQEGFELDNVNAGIRRFWLLGDIRLMPKVALLRRTSNGLALNAQLDVTFPTADPRTATGDNMVLFNPKINFSYDGAIYASLNVGAVIRKSKTIRNVTSDHELMLNAALGYTFRRIHFTLFTEVYATSPFARLFKEKEESPVEWDAGLKWEKGGVQLIAGGGLGLVRGIGSPAMRFFAGVRYTSVRYDRDGDGISDDVDKCPDDPEDKDGFEDHDGCPDPDNDKDGICDPWVAQRGLLAKYAAICHGSDKCPNDPEDKDGFEDEDGCPDPDNDKDGLCDPWVEKMGLGAKYAGICTGSDRCPDSAGPKANGGCPWGDKDKDGVLDNVDKCPTVPGPRENHGCPWGDKDKDGIPDNVDKCPDKPGPKSNQGCPLAQVTATKIEITQKVFFETGKAAILEKSYPLLAAVAQLLKDHPEIERLLVEGHTDKRGKRTTNLRLSQRRAKAVVDHLVKTHKIDKKRLKYKGYGPDRPLDKGDNETAWAKNRRVEFTIEKRRAKTPEKK